MATEYDLKFQAHDLRINALEKRSDDHSGRIKHGEERDTETRMDVASLRAEMRALTVALAEQTAQLKNSGAIWRKIAEAAISTIVPVVILGGIWLAIATGRIPGAHIDQPIQHEIKKP